MKKYYQILELPLDASQTEIKEQYRFLVHAWHPDKFPNPGQKAKADEKMKEINAAYDVLGNPSKRAHYDNGLRSQAAQHPPEPANDRQRAQEAARRQAQAESQEKEAAQRRTENEKRREEAANELAPTKSRWKNMVKAINKQNRVVGACARSLSLVGLERNVLRLKVSEFVYKNSWMTWKCSRFLSRVSPPSLVLIPLLSLKLQPTESNLPLSTTLERMFPYWDHIDISMCFPLIVHLSHFLSQN